MSSNAQAVTLLRRNKAEQVAALQELGFDVTEDMRAADFAKYIKWAVGLLDVTVAANRISDGTKWFFTQEEWGNLTYANKEKFLLRGVRVRANCLSFVIAPEECNSTLAWGSSTDVSALTNYAGAAGLYDDLAARANTEAIVSQLGEANSAAAAFCLNYRAYSEADGLEDTTQWALPTVAHLKTMYRYKNEINAVLKSLSESFALSMVSHWSCLEYSNSQAWCVELQSGRILGDSKSNTKKARPISIE